MSRLHLPKYLESHRTPHIGWLHAAVPGANDGIVSTASQTTVLMTGVAALVAGAMSMAAGGHVSVHSQADTEQADLSREKAELAKDPDAELRELTAIYVACGLAQDMARQVAVQLTAHDALGTHAREELGISSDFSAKPMQAALASAASFAVGAALAPLSGMIMWVTSTSLIFLALLGLVAAKVGGANVWASVGRVTFWGLLAVAATAGAGWLSGAVL